MSANRDQCNSERFASSHAIPLPVVYEDVRDDMLRINIPSTQPGPQVIHVPALVPVEQPYTVYNTEAKNKNMKRDIRVIRRRHANSLPTMIALLWFFIVFAMSMLVTFLYSNYLYDLQHLMNQQQHPTPNEVEVSASEAKRE